MWAIDDAVSVSGTLEEIRIVIFRSFGEADGSRQAYWVIVARRGASDRGDERSREHR